MQNLNHKKINKFINESENYLNKYILVINQDIKENIIYMINSKKTINLEDLCNKFNHEQKDFYYLRDISRDIKFDFVFIYNASFSIKQNTFKQSISSFERFFKSGTRIFAFYGNSQNIIYYLRKLIFKNLNKYSYSIKKFNLNSGNNYMAYDYYYFSYLGNIKKNKILIKFISLIFNILSLLDLQRLFFLSSNILVKYVYVNKSY